MKNDSDKPIASRFYWEGLKKLNPEARPIIDRYLTFVNKKDLYSLAQVCNDFQICFQEDYCKIVDQVNRIYHYGANKYGEKNYLGLEIDRIIEAMGRHLRDAVMGILVDDESGYFHASHVMANILIAAELL